MKEKGYAKFWKANKVHYGRCGSGVYTDLQYMYYFIIITQRRPQGSAELVRVPQC